MRPWAGAPLPSASGTAASRPKTGLSTQMVGGAPSLVAAPSPRRGSSTGCPVRTAAFTASRVAGSLRRSLPSSPGAAVRGAARVTTTPWGVTSAKAAASSAGVAGGQARVGQRRLERAGAHLLAGDEEPAEGRQPAEVVVEPPDWSARRVSSAAVSTRMWTCSSTVRSTKR